MLDLGANKESNENHLLQFSIMGHAFAKINNISEPKVAILNIGTEEGKGKGYLQAASDLITKSFLKNNFIGFIEPDQITSGKADVIVTDGFTGNIALKTAEGLSRFIMGNFKHIFSQNINDDTNDYVDLFIYPGYKFKVIDVLLTNFHLPKSTLLLLVCAFGGKDIILNAYKEAVKKNYRFYSYGDCMLINKL